MNTEIRKDKRCRTTHFHKARLGQTKTKAIAMRDITEDCAKTGTVNYVNIEALVLAHCTLKIPIIELNTNY